MLSDIYIFNCRSNKLVFLDFFPNLFNKSGKTQTGRVGLKDGFEESIFNGEN